MKKVNYYFSAFIFLVVTSFLYGCLTAGTHGSIKAYNYPVKKEVLQKAVDKVIAGNINIKRGDTTHKNYIVDITNGKNDTIYTKYPNAEAYIDITIIKGDVANEYTFQYSGDKDDWDTSKTSCLSIAYAHDKEGNGGSEGNVGVTWYTPFLRKKLVSVFEIELIDKVDTELGIRHTVE